MKFKKSWGVSQTHNSYNPLHTLRSARLFLLPLFLAALVACNSGGGGNGNTGGDDLSLPSPQLVVSFAQTKIFRFSWNTVAGADSYRLEENPDGQSGFTPVADNITTTTYNLEVPLYARAKAQYILYACNTDGCTASNTVTITGNLVNAIGYIKASNTGAGDSFGYSVSLSGNTLAVGADGEDSSSDGVGNSERDNRADDSGAVYVFRKDSGNWVQDAYVKASNTDEGDNFGYSVSLSGNMLAVGAYGEDSSSDGIGGNQDNSADNYNSGAVYVFRRNESGDWTQDAYIKASNTGASDFFGWSVSLSGNMLAVGANQEGSNSTGVGGDETDDSAIESGAVYIFRRNESGDWSQDAYIKASNTGAGDSFGYSVSLSGNMLAVGARLEASNSTGVDSDETNNSAGNSGAVYVFRRNESGDWTQDAYIKASNTDTEDTFGTSVSLSDNTLAVGASGEGSSGRGINPDTQGNNNAEDSGAVYIFRRNDSGDWTQDAYIKASNTSAENYFGGSVSLSGNTLAVGADSEASSSTGVDGDETDNRASSSGAVYVFSRNDSGEWSQHAYIKASNTDVEDYFGGSVSISGNTLAVGASGEGSNATSINGNQSDNSADYSGAVYIY